MPFQKVELPPQEREGRKRVTLPEDEGKELLATLVKDAETDNPWLTDDKDYNTKAAAQARVLFYRDELHRLFPKQVQIKKQIGSRVIDANVVGGPKDKYRFSLRFRKPDTISDFDDQLKKVKDTK